jgi:hypothetical protein
MTVAGTGGSSNSAFRLKSLAGRQVLFIASCLNKGTALGYALNALTPKPNLSAAGAGYASVNALSPAAATGNIYGATRVGGITFYQETTNNNKFLHKLVAVAGHEVTAIGDIYLNDELVTLDGSGNVTSPSNYITYSKDRTNAGSFVVGKPTRLLILAAVEKCLTQLTLSLSVLLTTMLTLCLLQLALALVMVLPT